MKKLLVFLVILGLFSCGNSYQNYKVKFENGVSKVVELPIGYVAGDTVDIEVMTRTAQGDEVSYYFVKATISDVLKEK